MNVKCAGSITTYTSNRDLRIDHKDSALELRRDWGRQIQLASFFMIPASPVPLLLHFVNLPRSANSLSGTQAGVLMASLLFGFGVITFLLGSILKNRFGSLLKIEKHANRASVSYRQSPFDLKQVAIGYRYGTTMMAAKRQPVEELGLIVYANSATPYFYPFVGSTLRGYLVEVGNQLADDLGLEYLNLGKMSI